MLPASSASCSVCEICGQDLLVDAEDGARDERAAQWRHDGERGEHAHDRPRWARRAPGGASLAKVTAAANAAAKIDQAIPLAR